MAKKSDETSGPLSGLTGAVIRYGTGRSENAEASLLTERGYRLVSTTTDPKTGTTTYVFGKGRDEPEIEGGSRFIDITIDRETGTKKYALRKLPKFVRKLTKKRDAEGAKPGECFRVNLVYSPEYVATPRPSASGTYVKKKNRLYIPKVTAKSKGDLTMLFDSDLAETDATEMFHAVADYFRACGGLGLAVRFEDQKPNKPPRRL